MTKGKPATDILKQIVFVWDKNVELKEENVRLLKQVIHFEKIHEPMLAALRMYGIHTVVCCEVQVDGVPWKCTCGYAAAIAAGEGGTSFNPPATNQV